MYEGRSAGGDACALGFAEEPPADEAYQGTDNKDSYDRDARNYTIR